MRPACLASLITCAILGGCDPDLIDPYKRQAEAQASLPAHCRYIDRPIPIHSVPGYWCDDNRYGIPGDWATGPVVTPEGELLDPIVLHEGEGFTMACEEWEDPPFLSPDQGWASVLMCEVPYIDQGRAAFIPVRELWE
jgi:hypothetical protein